MSATFVALVASGATAGPEHATPDPVPLVKVLPAYSDEAKRAKHEGGVVLSAMVDPQGKPQEIKVVRPLGLGLEDLRGDVLSPER